MDGEKGAEAGNGREKMEWEMSSGGGEWRERMENRGVGMNCQGRKWTAGGEQDVVDELKGHKRSSEKGYLGKGSQALGEQLILHVHACPR